jgi:hypothetical protein
MSVSRSDIEQLQIEAGAAGDLEMVKVCARALDGSSRAWRECERVIANAQAMRDE